MNVYDLAETVTELCRLTAQVARLQGNVQTAERIDEVRRELEGSISRQEVEGCPV